MPQYSRFRRIGSNLKTAGVRPQVAWHLNATMDTRRPAGTYTQRFVPDSLKLRTARFEHAHRRFAELSRFDDWIK